jgi:8-oxo-dGTP diphosphatase
VSVLVVDDDRIVLCRRAPTTFRGGLWCLPCGFVDYGEDFLNAGRREVHEETGLAVTMRSIVSVVSNFHTPELHTLVVVMVADVIGGELRAGDDVDAVSWHRAGDALPPLAFEADAHIIERYREAPFAGAPVESPPSDDGSS